MTTVEAEGKKNQLIFSLVLGGLAGLAFAVGSWGLESASLLGAHGMFPFAKLLAGLVLCLPVGMLAGWLCKVLFPVFANVVLWVLAAAAFNRIALYVTFPGMQTMLGWLNPQVQTLVSYSIDHGVRTRAGLMLVIMAVFGAIVGLLFNSFVEEITAGTYPFRRWGTMLLWAAAFIGIATLGDSLNQKPMRSALVTVNEIIQFRLDHVDEEIPREVVLDMHLSGTNGIMDLIHQPRKLIYSGFDQMLIFVYVLVDFDGTWVRCSVINNELGTCMPLKGT